MYGLREGDFGDRRQSCAGHLPLDLVHGRSHRDQPLERYLALQLQAQLGLGSYKSAWLLLHKLRRAMV